MFITRATRHDRADLEDFFRTHDQTDPILDRGVAFVAREGGRIAGNVRLIEIEPNVLVIEDVLVREDLRGRGLGADLMRATMNSRGGTLYLCAHPERLRFYRDLGFSEIHWDELPEGVRGFFEETDSAPHQIAPDHIHLFLKAR